MDHFTDTTSNVVTVLDPLLVGTHTILPLSSSTMVPQVTPIYVGSSVKNQAYIGMPLPLISNLSLPPRYNALNSSIANPAQGPSRGPTSTWV
jgi:hypothetical protein